MKLNLNPIVYQTCVILLVLLLTGCPNPNRLPGINSGELSTQDIGFEVSVRQFEGGWYEGGDDIFITINPYQTDGSSLVATINLSGSDLLSLSVVDQNVEVSESLRTGNYVEFSVAQSSLRLPATFRIQLERGEGREDALNTFVTIDSLFETITPVEGAVIDKNGTAVVAWALRDGDGAPVDGAEYIKGVKTEGRDLNSQNSASAQVLFDTTSRAQDGISMQGSLPSIALVPEELLGDGSGPWELDVRLSAIDVAESLPISVEFDPALANTRMSQLFENIGSVKPKEISVSIQ